jgi:hypothetical protein
MNSGEATQELRARAEEIARIVTAMHPLVPRLENPAAQNEILRSLFELTKQVEVVKKQLLIVQKRDESKLL